MPAGGYQKPSKPAPVSGPGAQSKRTDGGPAQKLRDLPDAAYGENATFRELQQGAQLAQSPSVRPPSHGRPAGGVGPMTPFSAPTAYPDEPINTPATGLPNQTQQLAQGDLERLERYLPALMEMANRPDSTPSFRNYVRLLRAKVR